MGRGGGTLATVAGIIILLVVLVMFANRGALNVGAGPKGASFGVGYTG